MRGWRVSVVFTPPLQPAPIFPAGKGNAKRNDQPMTPFFIITDQRGRERGARSTQNNNTHTHAPRHQGLICCPLFPFP